MAMTNAGDVGNHEQQPGSRSRGFIPPHGGYEDLLTFRKTRIIYDGTVRFCDRFVDFRSRTRDQMVQAARSGKQNILEGSQASGTSRESEIKLTSVARASLEELLEDYRDYLRVNSAAQWDRNSEEALFVRKLGAREGVDYEAFREFFDTRPAEVVANILICLIHQAPRTGRFAGTNDSSTSGRAGQAARKWWWLSDGGRWDSWDRWAPCAESFQMQAVTSPPSPRPPKPTAREGDDTESGGRRGRGWGSVDRRPHNGQGRAQGCDLLVAIVIGM
jgi:hypothetical protein